MCKRDISDFLSYVPVSPEAESLCSILVFTYAGCCFWGINICVCVFFFFFFHVSLMQVGLNIFYSEVSI